MDYRTSRGIGHRISGGGVLENKIYQEVGDGGGFRELGART